MTEVRTLVYFDLEATGLKSSGKPRICELSLVAVNIQDVLKLNKVMKENIKNGSFGSNSSQERKLTPRIINKLTLCIYPMATIVPLVSDITGLDNYNLTGQSRFSKGTGDLINSFLSLLPSPVCLVAHNGNDYDFPLLKAEMDKTGTKLQSDVLCIDSYVGMKKILKGNDFDRVENEKVTIVSWNEAKNIEKMESDAVRELISSGVFDTEMIEGMTIEAHNTKAENEMTPKTTGYKSELCLPLKKRKHLSSAEIVKSRKTLQFGKHTKPKSFSLINLHTHLVGYPPEVSHGAEADCLTLLISTAALGNEWIDWVRGNCFKFDKCKKMWG